MSDSSDSDLDSWILPTEFYHRDYTDLPKPVYDNVQKLQDPSPWASLLVQLNFVRVGGISGHGTGFYLDVPNATYKGSEVDVILTAAHNLMDGNGARTRGLKVLSQDKQEGWLVEDHLVGICPKYVESPEEGGTYYDWGVILQLLPARESKDKKPPKGFQFNLAFSVNPVYGEENALRTFMNTHICVSGYGGPQVESKPDHKSEEKPEGKSKGKSKGKPKNIPKDEPKDEPKDKPGDKPEDKLGRFVLSSGKGEPRSGRLEYRLPTQQGMSGSPVWATCDGNLTAVGIHTSAPEEWAPGVSKGVWLRLSIIEEILDMVGVLWLARKLQYQVPKQPEDEWPYLHFRSPRDPAVVRLGTDSLTTTFDVFPTGGRHDGCAAYAFRVRQPPEWRTQGDGDGDKADSLWVIWDVDRDRAILSSTLHKWSAVAFWEKPASKRPGKKNNAVSKKGGTGAGGNTPPLFNMLTFGTDFRKDRRLAMGSKYLRREDLCYGPVESSEVSFPDCNGNRDHYFRLVE
ncbi:hypothetical protein B0I37DRAFT_365624 [Chaetomium sp. MPI-CAGE-AT-0009]|nr:hypothetical protein B0I37DRAFT_365624 [Chaetomium sp. MPI-CAGE-AT-0009]